MQHCEGPENPKTTAGQSKKVKDATSSGAKATMKENATLAQRIEVLDWHHANGKNQTATAKHFNTIYPSLQLKQPRISKWLKAEPQWRERWVSSASVPGARDAKRALQTQHPQVTEMMDLWLVQARTAGLILTGDVLRVQWQKFADCAGVLTDDRLDLSNGWLGCLKHRHGLQEMK